MIDVRLSNQCTHAARPEYRKEINGRRRKDIDEQTRSKIDICLNCTKPANKCYAGRCKTLREATK